MYNKFTVKPKNKDITIEKQTRQYYLLSLAAIDLRLKGEINSSIHYRMSLYKRYQEGSYKIIDSKTL